MERSPDLGTEDITTIDTGDSSQTPDASRARGSSAFTGEIDTDFGTGTNQTERGRGVRQMASDAKRGVADQVTSQIQSQQRRAADTLSSVARTLRSSSDQLHEQQEDVASRLIEQAATKIDEFAGSLQNTNLGDLADRAGQFARRRPAVFIGAAFLAGVVAARFLKSSRRKMEEGQAASGPAFERASTGRTSDIQVSTPIVAESSRPTGQADGSWAPVVP